MASLSERSEQKRYESMKKKKRIIRITLAIFIVVAVVSSILFYVFFQMNRTYGGYEVINEFERKDSVGAQYLCNNDKLVKYSKDGAVGMKIDGSKIWDVSYELKNPKAVACGDYIAIADIGEKEIWVFDGSEKGTCIETEAPIVQVAVANQGVVAAVLQNNQEAQINIYDPYDLTQQCKVQITTSTDSDGYPVSIALSKDGQKLVTSYVNIVNGVTENSVNFYNFQGNWQDSENRMAGADLMGQTIVADLQFMTDDIVCAYMKQEVKLYRFDGDDFEEIKDIKIDNAINSVCNNSEYVALVVENADKTDKPYIVKVYDTNGELKLEKEIDYEYDTVKIENDELIFYSATGARILRFRGSEKLNCTFDTNVSYFFAVGSSDKYILIDGQTVKQILLEGRVKGE